MPTIELQTPLAAVVTAHPSLARELERLGLDYCCGGARRIDDACRDQGLDPASVVAELVGLADNGATAPWATMDVAELVGHLETTHHRYLWAELPRLTALVDKIVGVHGDRHAELHDVRRVYDELRADLEPHLRKEEQVLFPMIRQLASAQSPPTFHCGSLVSPISVMVSEHDRVGELLEQLRAHTHGYEMPADGCASYRACYESLAELEADTHLHVHIENNLLFPAVVRIEQQLRGTTT